jgi:hypothetical protein
MKLQEMIDVLEAAKKGKRIQYRSKWDETEGWLDCGCDHEAAFNFISCNYRVAPEPSKPREWWVYPIREGDEIYPPVHGVCVNKPVNLAYVKVREVIE